jgi:predicted Zn-dependent peptidase
MKPVQLHENLNIRIFKTGKFKDISFSFRFLSKTSQKDATIRALIAAMASDRNEKALTKEDMTRLSDQLYGSYVDVRNTGYGGAICTEFKSKVLNGRFVNQPVILDGFFDWMLDMIRYPLINEETLKEAKKNIRSNLIRSMDNPMKFAMKKAFETAGKGYPLSIDIQGSLEMLEEITVEDCKERLLEMIENSRLDVFVVGDVDENEIFEMIKNSFLFRNRQNVETMYRLESTEFTDVELSRKMNQSNLILVYNPQVLPVDQDYWPLRVAMTAFGQLPSSLCFTEIREKRSLCYTIGAQMITFDGVCFVYTGIDAQQAENVEKLVDVQLETVKNGQLSDSLIDASKKMMINSIRQIEDDANSIINYYYQILLIGRYDEKDEIIDEISKVTAEQIKEVFEKMTKVTRLLLKGEGNDEQDNESAL